MNDILLISTTFETEHDAEKFASLVLKLRLAGCAQITGPSTSLYWWNNAIEKNKEYVLTLKSRQSLYERLEKTIQENHPYDTPEILATKPSHCSNDYKIWLDKELIKD